MKSNSFHFVPAPDFLFILNQSLMGLFIIPPYGNVQFVADSSIVKLPYKVVPIHIYLQLFKY